MRGLAIAAALCGLAGVARANPVDAFGIGARAPAMGGAATAAADGAVGAYYNPAALALGDEIRIDFGYLAAKPMLSLNGADQGVDASHGIMAGLVVPGDVGPVHVAFGATITLPDERLIRTRTRPSGQPRWIYYDNRPQRFFFAAALALQLTSKLWIGGGLTFMSRTHGAIALGGRVGYPVSDDSTLDLDIDVSLIAVRYPEAGLLWRPLPWLDLGLTYRGSFVLELDQAFSLRGDLGPDANPIIRDASFALQSLSQDLFQPLQVAFGVAARITPRLLVTADLTYQRWSDMDNPASKITLQYDFKAFNELVHIPAQLPLEPTYFHDTFVPRIGIEVTALRGRSTTWYVRGGYAYEPSPAPEQRREPNLVDNDKHTFSAGLGVTVLGLGAIVPRPFDIDLFVAATALPERAHRKLSVTDGTGDYVSKGAVVAGGLATRWRF